MKKLYTLIILCYLTITLTGQNFQDKEINIKYDNGFEIFNVYDENPTFTFDESKEYYWYTEFSGIKSTKGGSGGKLLNGNYKLYDVDGNLITDKNYSLGILHGTEITWDSTGNITTKIKYDNGNIIYMKFIFENYWNEYIGPMFQVNTIHKIYTLNGVILQETKTLENMKQHIKIYYEYPANQLKEEYTTILMSKGDDFWGQYKSYYKNGNLSLEGQCHEDSKITIRIAKWKWYNEDGSLNSEQDFKAELLFWDNGEIKMEGGFIFDIDKQEWVKIEEWRWYDNSGNTIDSKTYDWGVELKE